jgi:hypothetical protein
MEAVPVYNINPVGNTCTSGNPWEAVALMNGGMGGGMGGWGGMWAFLPWLLLFGWGGFGGGFGGGWGGRGFGGDGCGCGCGCNNGYSNFAADLAVNNATATARNEAGLDFIAQNVNGLRNGLADRNVNLCGQFSNVINAVTANGYQTQLGQRDLQAQIADCCCRTQSGLADVLHGISSQLCQINYNNAMQTSEIKTAIAAEGAATRQLFQSQYTAEVERKLAEANQQLFVLKNFGQYAAGNGCGCNPCGNACGTC